MGKSTKKVAKKATPKTKMLDSPVAAGATNIVPVVVSNIRNVVATLCKVGPLNEALLVRRDKLAASIDKFGDAVLKASGADARKAEKELKAKERAEVKAKRDTEKVDKKKAKIAALLKQAADIEAELKS